MTEQELREKITKTIWDAIQERYRHPEEPVAHMGSEQILALIKEAGYVRVEDIETGYRKAGMQRVVDWVENQRMAAKTLIEGVGYGIVIPDEAWADFKKSEGVKQ